jgi:hypothetical protein
MRMRPRLFRFAAVALLSLGTAAAAYGVGRVVFGGDEGSQAASVSKQQSGEHSSGDPAHPIAGNFKPDGTKISECEGDFQCLEQAFGNLAYYRGPKATIRIFDRMLLLDGPVENDCHRIVHSIGSASLARFKGNVAQAFAAGSASCWSGYYHGILERAFLDAKPDDLGPISRRLCDDPGIRSTDYLAYQCVHGLGHGLMIYTGYNMPVSLEVCDELSTQWDQSSCSGGVFMENISSSYGITSKWVKEDDPVYPCGVVAEQHKYYCYLMVTSRILELNGYDWKETSQTCQQVEPDWIDICFQSYGRDASGFTRLNATKIVRLCRLAERWQKECIYGAARDMTANDAGARRSPALCSAAPLEMRSRCFNGIGTILDGLNADEAETRADCAAATKLYVKSCLHGAGLES